VAVESAVVSRDYATRVLSRLVDTPSATGAELECAQVLAEELAALGLRTQVQHFAPGRGNAVGTLAGTGGGQDLLICGHLDTSYSGHEEGLDAPGYQPRTVIDGDLLTGLGAANMKCGLAAAAAAVEAITREGMRLKGSVSIAGVAGEIEKAPVEEFVGPEYDGYGVGAYYLTSLGVAADAAIVGETTRFRVSVGRFGTVWLRVTIRGDLLHTAKVPGSGMVHAVEQAVPVLSALMDWLPAYQERNRFMGASCGASIGAVRSGDPWRLSRTPRDCRIYLDLRIPPGKTPMSVRREVEQLLEGLSEEHDDLSYTVDSYVAALPALVSEDEPIVGVLRRASRQVLGEDRGVMFRGPMDDSGHLLAAGIPTVNFGLPRPNPNADKDQRGESVSISDVVTLGEIYKRAIYEFCGVV
jgi:acetylornithine deacetylase/succinyl-diaminopimelate desuccinylase-like protein